MHFDGEWLPSPTDRKVGWSVCDYKGGKEVRIKDVNGDEMNIMKLNSMILQCLPNQWGYTITLNRDLPPLYIDSGILLEIVDDKDILMAFNDADYIDGSDDLHVFICIDVLVEVGSTQPPQPQPPPTETHPPQTPPTPTSPPKRRVKIIAKKKLTPKKDFAPRVESFIPENDIDEIPPQAEAQPPPPPVNEANEPEIPNATYNHDPLDAEAEEEYHSVHSDSEVESEPDSSDDEFQPDPATQEFVNQTSNVYNENESEEHPQPTVHVKDLELKMQFNNMKEFRDYIRTYAILKNFVWEYVKNDGDRARLKCHDKECNWLCYAKQKRNEATVIVKTLRAEHTCVGDPNGKNPLANSDWVAKQLEEDVRVHQKSYTVRDIVIECWKRFTVTISYWVAWSARWKVMELIHGNYEKSYVKSPACASMILLKNPGSVAYVTRKADNTFNGMVVGFAACLHGFISGCRPLIGLDGCFLKGKFGGVCLAACALDGNNGMFPIGIYICNQESKETWTYFLNQLKPHVTKHPKPLTFISDQGKGLDSAVTNIFPTSTHRFCFRHLYKNFKKHGFGGKHLENLSWGAARAYMRSDFEKMMASMLNDCKGAYKYLAKDNNVVQWARCFNDGTTKCEHITNNFSESFNNWILQIRDKPVCQFVEHFQNMLMSLLYERIMKCETWEQEGIVPRAASFIEKMKEKRNEYIVRPSSLIEYQVQGVHESWTVNLQEKTCDCRIWLLTGIPCIHAVCVIHQRRLKWAE